MLVDTISIEDNIPRITLLLEENVTERTKVKIIEIYNIIDINRSLRLSIKFPQKHDIASINFLSLL